MNRRSAMLTFGIASGSYPADMLIDWVRVF
jgi:hypothetical protein